MNITQSTRTLVEYQLVVTADEAAGALVDPFSFGEKIAEQLRAAGVTAPNENGHEGQARGGP